MHDPVLLISRKRIDIHIEHAVENAVLHIRVVLLEPRDQLLRLKPLRDRHAVVPAGAAGIRKVAGTLYKMKSVIIPPRLDILRNTWAG